MISRFVFKGARIIHASKVTSMSVRCFSSSKFGDISKQQSDEHNLPEFLRKEQFEDFGSVQGEIDTEEAKIEEKLKNVLGLEEFKQAVQCEQDKDYDEAELYLKETLKILKQADQEKTLGYLYILKRLAYISFKNSKYSESEKYFSVVANVMPHVSQNPVNIFSAHCNMLVLYTHTNIEKAFEYLQRVQKDSDDQQFSQMHQMELKFISGNIHLLNGDYKEAQNVFRNCLQSHGGQEKTYKILNNLAYASWKISQKGEAQKDDQFIISWLKESIQKEEQNFQAKSQIDLDKMQLLDDLTDPTQLVPKDFTEKEQEYFTCLESKNLGKAISNLSEYLLEDIIKQKAGEEFTQESGFWFRLGLKYFESNCPEEMERQLILLGLFYASNGDFKSAENLYLQAIEKMENEKNRCFTLVMAKNLYGRMLMSSPKRQKEAILHLKQSEALVKRIPFWWDDLDHIYVNQFQLD